MTNRFKACLLSSVFAVLLGGASSSALAQVPRVLHYQATLIEESYPVEGTVDVELAFYSDSTGGSPVSGWSEMRPDVPVEAGRMSLLIGSQTPLPDALFAATPLYLQVSVDSEPLPRMQVASTAYALRATLAEGVVPGSVVAAALADGAVTSAAIADGAVTRQALSEASVATTAVADGAITASKLAPNAVSTRVLADGAVTSAKLGPSAVVGSVLADGAVTRGKLGNGSVTASKIATGAVVSSLNELTDGVRLVGGENVTITPNTDAGTITIAADSPGQPSSRRWKTNVEPLNGLALVQQLRGVRYEWTTTGTPDIGVIAEEVGTVVPEVVTYAPNGTDAESVNYAKLVALLIEAVKSQQAQIETDQALLQELRTRIEALERQGDATNASPEPR